MHAYRANVFGNWAKALAGTYPIVRKIVGEGFFEALAREYALSHPSTSGDLNEYGALLAQFVETFPHTLDLPYLPDVARMEWLAHRACYAAEAAPFDCAASISGNSRLRLAPACALMGSAWPLGCLWTVHQDDYAGAFDVDLSSGPDRILVWRRGWRAQVRSLAPGDFRFLAAAATRTALGEALESALAADPAFDASAALARWVEAEVLTL